MMADRPFPAPVGAIVIRWPSPVWARRSIWPDLPGDWAANPIDGMPAVAVSQPSGSPLRWVLPRGPGFVDIGGTSRSE